ncbi:MAG: hypothetical protein RBS43_05715 [Candidatus Cloacimonas sp.]|jgi:Fe-S cluster assembly iron-binding protein IscA|nr:hypothetical protein [Candidatus Cloacimonas sp.]
MNITVSETARLFLKRKEGFYLSQNRKAKLIEVAKTCHGAEFRVVFETPSRDDKRFETDGCEIYVAPRLVEEYGGFSLDTQSFFFAPRLLVSPERQNYSCDCKAKCNNQPVNQELRASDKEDK